MIQVGCVGHADVEVDFGKLFGLVGNRLDLAVWNVVDSAVHVPQCGDTQGDVLDAATKATNVDNITDAVLVFKDDEETGNDVADQVLTAKTDGNAEYTGTGEDGNDV